MIGSEAQLPQSIQDIIRQIEQLENFSPHAIRLILRNSSVTSQELEPWADFEHSAADAYGRKMIYNGAYYEIMCMAWSPGDFSAIHDHGYTEWGAVKVFGEMEHASFMLRDGILSTLSRNSLKAGQVLAVGHDLIHQMGNSGEKELLTLHVYGNVDGRNGVITADARLFEASKNVVQRVDGGVFFHLPPSEIKREEKGIRADFMTALRNDVESLRRFEKMKQASLPVDTSHEDFLKKRLFSADAFPELIEDLEEQLDENGFSLDSLYWKNLCKELKEAALQQAKYKQDREDSDAFASYAELYDEVIGRPCLKSFMSAYWDFVIERYDIHSASTELFSIGCGTAIIEDFLIKEKGFDYNKVYGMDLSEGMVKEARKRIRADIGNALELDPKLKQWDLVYCGLNVFQYLNQAFLEAAIKGSSDILKEGGLFVGDFICSDHIRKYPNLIYSEDRRTISFRSPELIAIDNFMYQQSEIVNMQIKEEGMHLSYEGKHKRYLAPMSKVRRYFKKHFSQFEFYDALSLEPIPKKAETCESTRYLVVARK